MTPSPIRILFVIHDGQLYGSQHSLLLLLQHLSTGGYCCDVSIARVGELQPLIESSPALFSHVRCYQHKRLQWFKHDRRNPLQQVLDVFGLLVNSVVRVWPLVQHIRRHNIQLVHTNSCVSLEGALAAWLTGIPHVWHMREMALTPSPKLFPVLGYPLTRWLIHHLSRKVLCISLAVRHQFVPNPPEVSTESLTENTFQDSHYPLLYNAIDHQLEEQIASLKAALQPPPVLKKPERKPETIPVTLPEEPPGFRLGYLGRLSEGKRFHDILPALARCHTQGLKVTLEVAGSYADKAYAQYIEHLLHQYQLHSVVRFLGFIHSKQAFFQSIDALVIPSLNEPFGRVALEAILSGTPCIAAQSGGLSEILRGPLITSVSPDARLDRLAPFPDLPEEVFSSAMPLTGCYYPAKDTDALARAIGWIHRHQERFQSTPATLDPRFRPETQKEQLLALYQNVLHT